MSTTNKPPSKPPPIPRQNTGKRYVTPADPFDLGDRVPVTAETAQAIAQEAAREAVEHMTPKEAPPTVIGDKTLFTWPVMVTIVTIVFWLGGLTYVVKAAAQDAGAAKEGVEKKVTKADEDERHKELQRVLDKQDERLRKVEEVQAATLEALNTIKTDVRDIKLQTKK